VPQKHENPRTAFGGRGRVAFVVQGSVTAQIDALALGLGLRSPEDRHSSRRLAIAYGKLSEFSAGQIPRRAEHIRLVQNAHRDDGSNGYGRPGGQFAFPDGW